MGCHPSHSLSYLSEGFKPPTRYNMICSWTTSRVILAQYLRFAMTKYMPWYFIAVFVVSFLKTPRKAGMQRGRNFFGWYKMVQTQLVGAFTSIHLGGCSQLTFFFCGWTHQPVDLLTPLSIDSSTIDPTDVGCLHQLIAKKLSKIAKSDERRPPITYLVPSVIPLSHHWMPFKHPHFFEIPMKYWVKSLTALTQHRSCGRRCSEQDQESLGRAISGASKSQEILGEWNMAGKYISVIMVIHGG